MKPPAKPLSGRLVLMVWRVSLQDLSTDDAITIIEELEQDDLQDVLAALSAKDRVLVEEGLSFPGRLSRSIDAARNRHGAIILDCWPNH